MADWPAERYHKPVIGTFSSESVGVHLSSGTSSAASSGANTSANNCYFYPLAINAPYLVRKVWWHNGATVAGNVDVGVFSGDPTTPAKLFSSGSTAQSGASVTQSVSLGTPYLLTPGSYYLAISISSTTATFLRQGITVGVGAQFGCGEVASTFPLPATATLIGLLHIFVPMFGITSGTVL